MVAEIDRKKLAATVSKLRNRISRFRDSGTRIGEENTKVVEMEFRRKPLTGTTGVPGNPR